jgi:hypothetical protein
MSSHYQIKFKTERIVEIIYGCYRYRQFVTDIDINRAEASAIFSFSSPRPRTDFQRLSSYQIPSYSLKASAEERVKESLALKNCFDLIGNPDRKNIYYEKVFRLGQY